MLKIMIVQEGIIPVREFNWMGLMEYGELNDYLGFFNPRRKNRRGILSK
ncbi:hypothetical protein [Chryseobacterium sp. G0186]|nr:hypothetical protein [Chryseobacterium sp. G0186]